MPKKIAEPNCTLTLTFTPTKLRIELRFNVWVMRAQQTSICGTSWVTVAEMDSHEAALALATALTDGRAHVSNGITVSQEIQR